MSRLQKQNGDVFMETVGGALNTKISQDFTCERIKHLEMIQGVITRMANSSAWMKRLAIVIVGLIATLAAYDNSNTNVLLICAAILLAILWLMDARYLQQERWFRTLFDAVRKENSDDRPDFCITPSPEIRCQSGFWKSALSWSTLLYYGPVIFLAIFVLILACMGINS